MSDESMAEEEFLKLRFEFSRDAYVRREDGLYMAVGSPNGKLVIDVRSEDELPPPVTGQILIKRQAGVTHE